MFAALAGKISSISRVRYQSDGCESMRAGQLREICA